MGKLTTIVKSLFNPSGRMSSQLQYKSNKPQSMGYSSTIYKTNRGVISEKEMLQLSEFMSAVDLVADSFAKIEFHFNSVEKKTGFKKIAYDTNFELLVNKTPNTNQSAYSFKKQIIYNLFIKKRFIALIIRTAGVVSELVPIDPNLVVIQQDEKGNYWYEIKINGNPFKIDEQDVLLIDWNSVAGYQDVSFNATHQVILQLLYNIDAVDQSMTTNTSTVTGALKVPDILNDEQKIALRDNFKAMVEGSKENGAGVLILDSKYEFQQFQNIDKSALLDKDFRLEIARRLSKAFRIPLAKLGYPELGGSAYKSTTEMNMEYVQEAVTPWAEQFVSELNRKFAQYTSDRTFTYDLSPLIKHDMSQLSDIALKLISNGIMTPNEARNRFFNLPPDPNGNFLMVNSATQPISDIHEKNNIEINNNSQKGGVT